MNSYHKTALNFGLIGGLSLIVFQILLYVIDPKLIGSWIASIAFLFYLVFIPLAQAKQKKLQAGFISFREAFSTGFVTIIVMVVIAQLFNLLLHYVIDPNLHLVIKEVAIESSIGLMEKIGADDDLIEKQLEELEKQSFKPQLWHLLLGLAGTAIMMSIISAIGALIFKKDNPEQLI